MGIKICKNKHIGIYMEYPNYSEDISLSVKNDIKTLPGYIETPLVKLNSLSEELNLKSVYVKDESKRFGLNSFKGLGGGYAALKILSKMYNLGDDITFDRIKDRVKDENITFITATDGNHGRGIAWIGKLLGKRSIIYMPKGTKEDRVKNVEALGAKVIVTELNYDDTVRLACKESVEKGYLLIQDTAWDGYEEVPKYIMQGYLTLGNEIKEELREEPTHIFLQAGVGAMSGALTAYFRNIYKGKNVKIIIVEPDKADCIYRTIEADDGVLHKVTGEMDSIMAGLCCGEPCTIGYDVLRTGGDFFMSVDDTIAMLGMRKLGYPCGNDFPIISGESGGVTTGVVIKGSKDQNLRNIIGLNENSVVLCISTEGDTDKENYRKIMESKE